MSDIDREIALAETQSRTERQAAIKPSLLARVWHRFDAVAKPVAYALLWVLWKLSGALIWFWHLVAMKDGYFAPRKFGFNVIKIGILVVVVPWFFGAFYYYGTWSTHRNIYIPSSGVFQSQQFVRPNGAGQVIAPRDEIYTVLGKEIVNGVVQPVRFDLDMNWYFFFFRAALRPDLAASEMDSQSPYGVKCDFETTGIYNRLPRYWRLKLLRWWDVRAEIVDVIKCEEVEKLPDAFAGGRMYAPSR